MKTMLLQNLSRSQLIRQTNASSSTRRCLSSSTSRFSHSPCTKASDAPDNGDSSIGEQSQQTQIFDERTLITQLSPLKRILCLCPVSLGRGRISWSGGDAAATSQQQEHQQQTINLDFQTQYSNKRNSNKDLEMMHQQLQQLSSPPPKVGKYRYGERFAIGVAVSDPYLTHALPVQLKRNNGVNNSARFDDDDGTHCFTAEIVPSFKGDMHNLNTTSPIFHTNLPYFRKDFLQHIGHTDIGAVVLALPMETARSAFCPMPTKLQLEEERKSEEVREYLFGLLQNYVSSDSGSLDEDEQYGKDGALDSNNINTSAGVPFFGPLNLQGLINHRLSAADVLSKVTEDGNWDHLIKEIRQSHGINSSTSSRGSIFSRGNKNFGGNMDESNIGLSTSIPPNIHAAVALNAMLERHTIGYHNSFF